MRLTPFLVSSRPTATLISEHLTLCLTISTFKGVATRNDLMVRIPKDYDCMLIDSYLKINFLRKNLKVN